MDIAPLLSYGTPVSVIDRFFSSGIIPSARRPTSSMAEQLTLNQWVQGSSPWSVTGNDPRFAGRFDSGMIVL